MAKGVDVISISKVIELSPDIIEMAEVISKENHDITNPKLYTKHVVRCLAFEKQLSGVMNLPTNLIDYVLFSSRSGAKRHKDIHLKHLHNYTYIVPIILPKKSTILMVGNSSTTLELGVSVYFNHQVYHELVVQDDSACVLVMASEILKDIK